MEISHLALEIVEAALEVTFPLLRLLESLAKLGMDHLLASVILLQLLYSASVQFVDNLEFADTRFEAGVGLLESFV